MTYTSKIGIGSVQFGMSYGISNSDGQTSDEEVLKILDLASNYGITTIDTASSYGNSESVLGKYSGNKFDVISKFMPSLNALTVIQQFEKSIHDLKTKGLYAYLAHRPLELITNRQDWEEIKSLKSENRIQKIGFSLNEPSDYYELLEANIIPDIVQVPFNYFDSRFKQVLTELKENGCEVHTRSTFLQGLFFMDTSQLSSFFNPCLSELDFLQNTHKENLSASLLKHVLDQTFIDKVIIGIESAQQLQDNIEGLNNAHELHVRATKYDDTLVMPMHWPKN
jgi:aryl-alcohol dehydrogenase-like predicted oxidoreductase